MTSMAPLLQLVADPGIPSPSQGTWYLWIIPMRAYALLIITGIFVGGYVGDRRWIARGGQPGTVVEILMWAMPAGIIGARIYHVLSRLQDYAGPGQDPWDVLRIWEGGLAIFGGLIGGGLGAWYACRRQGVALPAFADALAPGIAIGQAFGRRGNYFNPELHPRRKAAGHEHRGDRRVGPPRAVRRRGREPAGQGGPRHPRRCR